MVMMARNSVGSSTSDILLLVFVHWWRVPESDCRVGTMRKDIRRGFGSKGKEQCEGKHLRHNNGGGYQSDCRVGTIRKDIGRGFGYKGKEQYVGKHL